MENEKIKECKCSSCEPKSSFGVDEKPQHCTKIKINCVVEKDNKEIKFNITPQMVYALFDLQYMMDDTWKTIKLNKIDKDIKKAFAIIDKIQDCIYDGKTYKYEDGKFILSKHKHYYGGKAPEWKNKK